MAGAQDGWNEITEKNRRNVLIEFLENRSLARRGAENQCQNDDQYTEHDRVVGDKHCRFVQNNLLGSNWMIEDTITRLKRIAETRYSLRRDSILRR